MSKIFILLVFAFGQPDPVVTKEYASASACESKAHFINAKKDQYSARCIPKDKVEQA